MQIWMEASKNYSKYQKSLVFTTENITARNHIYSIIIYHGFKFSSQVEKQDDCTMDYNLSNSNSSSTFPRVSFKGDYHNYECTIQVKKITPTLNHNDGADWKYYKGIW